MRQNETNDKKDKIALIMGCVQGGGRAGFKQMKNMKHELEQEAIVTVIHYYTITL